MEELRPSREELKKKVPNVFILINFLRKRAREISLTTLGGKKESEILKEVMKELEEGKIAPKIPGT